MEVNGYTIKRGANLSGADLSGADLSGADLSGADLTNANLTNANLSAADLHVGRRNSEWIRRNQNGHTLYDPVTWPIPPSYFDMTPTNLSGANLSGANLSGANLSGANLTRANLTRANLTDANLTDANLTDATMRALIDEIKLSEASRKIRRISWPESTEDWFTGEIDSA